MQWDFNKMTQVKVKDRGLCAAGLGPCVGFPSVSASSLRWASPVLPSPSGSSAELGWSSWRHPAAPRSWGTHPPPGRAGLRGPSRRWLQPAWWCHWRREPRLHGNLRNERHGEGTEEREFQEMWVSFFIEMSNVVLQSDLSMRNSIGQKLRSGTQGPVWIPLVPFLPNEIMEMPTFRKATSTHTVGALHHYDWTANCLEGNRRWWWTVLALDSNPKLFNPSVPQIPSLRFLVYKMSIKLPHRIFARTKCVIIYKALRTVPGIQ